MSEPPLRQDGLSSLHMVRNSLSMVYFDGVSRYNWKQPLLHCMGELCEMLYIFFREIGEMISFHFDFFFN